MADDMAGRDAAQTSPLDEQALREQIARLEMRIASQERLIAGQGEALAQSQKIFERASQAARIGVWQCSLPDERIIWTDMVYDLFDLPRGSPINRDETVKCYAPDSAAELREKRTRAIAERSGFSMDAEIVSFKGNRRFIRITASVESSGGQPLNIFGMKQDITDEKLLNDRMRYLAEYDVMTGLANRAYFQREMAAMNEAGAISALMLIDLDGFKAINDTLGHAVGDEWLQEAARRLQHVCGNDASLIARIGGDEFAVLFPAGRSLGVVADAARSAIAGIAAPVPGYATALRLGASIGIAKTDGCDVSELFIRADSALYAAKRAGRSTFRIHKPDLPGLSQQSSAVA